MCVRCTGFHEWWSAGSLRQNLVNCSGCAEISSVLEVPESLRGTVTLRRGPQLVLLKVRGQHRQGWPSIESFSLCSCWFLFVLAGLCRVESPSACSGSSLRSFTWHIQAPCPSCWRRTTVCRTTTSDSHKDPPTSLCSGTHSCSKYIPKTSVHGLCGTDCDRWLGVTLQEVQLRDQGEGVAVALPEGWALPPAGQCWDHCAALPRHPQHKLPEQGEFTCPDVLTLTGQRTNWETVLLLVQTAWKLNRCSHVQLLAYVVSEANNRRRLCFRVSGCSAGWWWARVCQQCEFCPSNVVRNTAAPSTCGWHLETWVTHLHTCFYTFHLTLQLSWWLLPLTRAVYADPRYWQMELFPGRGQNIICDGSAF